MKIEESFLAVSGYFDLWVRLVEIRTRIMEVQDSGIDDLRILVISPPTDRGIKVLAQANPGGKSHLLCFSAELAEIAKRYALRHGIEGLQTSVEPFFSILSDDNYYDAVFANCFFDFCQQADFITILQEIKRALKPGGMFFAVYMDLPTGIVSRIWDRLFSTFQLLSQSCHPVDIRPSLSRCGFELKKDITMTRLEFPIKYLMAEG
jgi:SAM-dependent methyltransferase